MADFWKNKKVIVYVALLHHTRFLIPISNELAKSGAKINYVVGQAERSQEITARECNLNYKHVFDYITNDDFEKINENYLKLRKIFGNALKKNYAIGAQMVTVMDKTLHATAEEYVGFKNLIKKEQPDICFALHEVNRWGKMLSFWAKKMNIPLLTLQEGLGYDLNFGYIGHIQYSTLCLAWGERIRAKFGDYEAPVERIIPVGNTHIAEEKNRQEKNNIRKKMRKKFNCSDKFANLLIFSAIHLAVDKVLPLFKATSKNSHLTLFVKFHPAGKQDEIKAWEESIPDEFKERVYFIHGEENTYDLLALCDLCTLAQPGTTGLEAIALGKPLVQLDVDIQAEVPYSFTDQNVAIKMTSDELATALSEKMNFTGLIDKKVLRNYLKNELTDTTGAKERIIKIAEKIITANKFKACKQIALTAKDYLYKWSIILSVPANAPNEFLVQLESLSVYSKDSGEYEVILIEPDNPSKQTCEILASLKGNIRHIAHKAESNTAKMMNIACKKAQGENLVILTELLCPNQDKPCDNWLAVLTDAFKKYGANKIFGAKITDIQHNIVHAGMLLDENNAPISAYRHLNSDFPKANIERPFQILDFFIALKKKFFLKLGGFWTKSGQNAFMDICLRAQVLTADPNTAIYLPSLQLAQLNPLKNKINFEDSINFYGKWHGTLWENKEKLYKNDGVTKTQLTAARLDRALKTT